MSNLLIAEHEDGVIAATTLNTLAAAVAIGGDTDVLIAGEDCSASEQVAKLSGVRTVLVAKGAHLAHGLAENLAQLVADLVNQEDYSHVICAATTSGKNVLPRLGGLLDAQPISDISAVVDGETFQRPIYAGNCIATVRTTQKIKLISVRVTAFDPVASEGGSAQVREVDAGSDQGLSQYLDQELTKSERPDLVAANIVISGGRGMQSGDNFHLLESVADKLGAAIGASRAAVDSGYAPNDMQVGQTGKIVAPELYIAVGISGAIQHLAGMKDSKVIVAINKDEEAPIFQVADYGLVADLFQAVPELESAL